MLETSSSAMLGGADQEKSTCRTMLFWIGLPSLRGQRLLCIGP